MHGLQKITENMLKKEKRRKWKNVETTKQTKQTENKCIVK